MKRAICLLNSFFPRNYKLYSASLYSYANMLSIALHVTAAISLNTKHCLAPLLGRLCADGKVKSSCGFNVNARLSLQKVRFTFFI
jgi:hypothetical protein